MGLAPLGPSLLRMPWTRKPRVPAGQRQVLLSMGGIQAVFATAQQLARSDSLWAPHMEGRKHLSSGYRNSPDGETSCPTDLL